MNARLHVSATPKAVALDFAKFLQKLVAGKQHLHIALSGGSTPQLLFDLLASEFQHLPWDRFHFYWGDERCVAPEHPESNYGMTKKHLFDPLGLNGKNIHRILGENQPDTEASRYGELIASQLPIDGGKPRFNLVMLGLGTDGHTASIFPHEMKLLNQNTVCGTATHPETGQKRITLTGPVINNAESVIFLATGKSKNEKVREILKQSGNYRDYPASYIAPKHGNLHWFLDQEAAAGL